MYVVLGSREQHVSLDALPCKMAVQELEAVMLAR